MAGGHGHGALPTHTLHPGKRSASGGGARTWGAAAAAALIFIALLNAAYFARSGAAARAGAIGGAALSLLPEHPAGPLPRAAAGGGGVAGGAADDGGFATPDQEAASLAYLQEYVLKKPRLERPPVEGYWIEDFQAKNATVAEYRTKVRDYIASDAFKQGWDALKGQTGNERGIVISAGGEYYLPQAVVLLRQLRRHLNSTLPVEIYWHGDGEMDAGSLEALKAEFGPLEGYDASKLPYPSHHVPGVKIVGFPMKPYALLNSKFKHALLLDCDMQLLRDPAYLFDSPEYRAFGNLFWGDIYSEGMVRDEAYDYVGLNRAALASVNAGKGDFPRYAESGQVLIDRTRHLGAACGFGP
ncbi:hypothetical protein Rsub_03102 [Raphidocelis subcapitata]|uniref:Uncharacterized protein n=1 Tax=Raphidocelis subcapitata TaxID=307507 RepID=A0A2V0NT37_9CHLO|nr:hypothetical protein Rsub_03102 [Raphidocelis subcapitata]|eukprot:GBF90801.1 hypothetical protein Rsub_03102 [Raphidocelis subcapitata]